MRLPPSPVRARGRQEVVGAHDTEQPGFAKVNAPSFPREGYGVCHHFPSLRLTLLCLLLIAEVTTPNRVRLLPQSTKKKMINIIQATHLDKTDLDTDPRHFMGYDLKVVREHFAEFTGSYFRSFYFSMAPLLAIPLYQLTRSHDDIWKTPHDRQSSFWEHETMANYQGQDLFRHPDSVTKNLLETAVVSENEDRQVLNVTAHGYRGVPRVDYVSVKGGDGYYHDVPVHWTEYLPVSRSSLMTVAENNELSLPAFRRKALSEPALSHAVEGGQWKDVENYFRRSMVAFLGDVPLVGSEMAQEKKADSESVEAE